jgi:hypothetical protein
MGVSPSSLRILPKRATTWLGLTRAQSSRAVTVSRESMPVARKAGSWYRLTRVNSAGDLLTSHHDRRCSKRNSHLVWIRRSRPSAALRIMRGTFASPRRSAMPRNWGGSSRWSFGQCAGAAARSNECVKATQGRPRASWSALAFFINLLAAGRVRDSAKRIGDRHGATPPLLPSSRALLRASHRSRGCHSRHTRKYPRHDG